MELQQTCAKPSIYYTLGLYILTMEDVCYNISLDLYKLC